jgi:hypothetical protein
MHLHLLIFSNLLKIAVFWDVTPYSLVDRYQCFRETCSHHLRSPIQMMAGGSSKTLVPNYQTTWQHNSDDHNHDIHHPENRKSRVKPMLPHDCTDVMCLCVHIILPPFTQHSETPILIFLYTGFSLIFLSSVSNELVSNESLK